MADTPQQNGLVDANALDRYQQLLSSRAQALSTQIAAAPSNIIRTKGRVFTMPDGRTNQGPLVAVILDFVGFNSYFDGVYNPANPKPPVCWAVGDLRTLQPSGNSTTPQHTGNCVDCPKNQWGTSLTGKGKACKNQMKLALIAGDLAKADPSQIFTINVSPTGIKGFSAYCRRVQRTFGDDALPIRTIVDIGFDPNQTYPTLTFENFRPNPNLGIALDLLNDAREMLNREPAASDD
jgi:hypothetical protein